MKVTRHIVFSAVFVLCLTATASATAVYSASSTVNAAILTTDPNLSFISSLGSLNSDALTLPPGSDATAATAASSSVNAILGTIDVSAAVNGSTGTNGVFSAADSEAVGSLTLLYTLLPNGVALPLTVPISVDLGFTASASVSVSDLQTESASATAAGSGALVVDSNPPFFSSAVNVSIPSPLFAAPAPQFVPLGAIYILDLPVNTPVVLTLTATASGQANSGVPEPTTLLLFGSALSGLFGLAKVKHTAAG